MKSKDDKVFLAKEIKQAQQNIEKRPSWLRDARSGSRPERKAKSIGRAAKKPVYFG